MRLSTVFELLLIFLFLALASSRHIEKKQLKKGLTKQSLNSYCKCSELQCNCCRDFPVVPIKGPGCATLGYHTGDVLRLTMSFGDRVLRNITLVGKRPKPVCMGLPGGVTKFCGRLYNIERLDDHFKACLSLELRALDELEAGIRVSCFNFGPKGVKLEPGEPPSSTKPADDYDDDDDYDIDDEDDDDDDDEFDDDDDEYNDIESDGDYTGFAALSDQIFEGFFFPESSGNKKKKPARPVTQATAIEVTTKTIPLDNSADTLTVTKSPLNEINETVSLSTEGTVETSSIVPKMSSTTPGKTNSISEVSATTISPVTEASATPELEKENETEDSESEEEEHDGENVQKEVDSNASVIEDEDSGEGSADEQLDESEKEFEVSDVKLENDDDEDEDEEDSDEEEEEESAEAAESAEEKDSDNILNVFFNRDDEPNETERERMRKEREHLKKILPGLLELLKPSPTPPTHEIHSFPAVRSARVHRRMRLPPI